MLLMGVLFFVVIAFGASIQGILTLQWALSLILLKPSGIALGFWGFRAILGKVPAFPAVEALA
jgi:hypothetical protein